MLPYAEDAWYTPSGVKTGYEMNFNRHFYKPQPMRSLEEIVKPTSLLWNVKPTASLQK